MSRSAAIALVTLVLFAEPNVAGGQAPCSSGLATSSPVQTAVEVRVGHYASGLLVALDSCGRLLVPVASTLSLAGIRVVEQQTGSVRGRVSNQLIVVDARRKSVRLGKTRLKVESSDMAETNDDVLLSLTVVAKLIGVDAAVYDEAGAIVEFRGVESLPVAAAARRLAAKEARSGSALTQYPTAHTASRGGVALEYDLSLGSHVGRKFWADEPIEVSGVATVATSIAGGVGSARFARSITTTIDDVSWTRAWPASRFLSELRLGDVTTDGPRSELVRGVAITNAPLALDQIATRLSFGGSLPDGWQVEAMRGTTVLDESIAQRGGYDLRVPVQRGTTVVDVVATSPAGEQRVFQRSLHTAPLFVAPGRFEYRAAVGACSGKFVDASDDRACRAAANADVRYGLMAGWALRGGVDLRTGDGGGSSTAQPYAGLGGVIARAVILEGTYAPNVGSLKATAAAAARFEPSPSLSVGADYSGSEVVARAVVADSDATLPDDRPLTLEYARGTRRSAWLHYAPSFWARRLAIDASASAYSVALIQSASQRVAIPIRLPSLQLMPFWRADVSGSSKRSSRRDALGTDILIVPGGPFTRLLGASWIRGSFEHGSMRDAWTASIAHTMRGLRFDVGARGGGARRGTALTLAIVPQLSRLQASTLMATDPGGRNARAMQRLAGSAIYDGAGRIRLSSEPALLRGGVTGVAFVDGNGNGKRDAGEQAISNARVEIGNRRAVTDSSGRFSTWGFAAHSLIDVRLDTLSLSSPWWVPASDALVARAPNAQLAIVNLPVVVAGSVRGRVELLAAEPGVAVPQVPLRLTHIASGATLTVDTFSDGEFYRDGLRPGEYRLTADEKFLEQLGLVADAVTFTLSPSGDAGQTFIARVIVKRRMSS